MKETSGTLLYKYHDNKLKVLIVRPAGFAAQYGWSIPKGHPEKDESLEAAAIRETIEETGCHAAEPLHYLGYIDYTKSKKRIHCFTGAAVKDEIPQPDLSEVSKAEFVAAEDAAKRLHPEQSPFIDLLKRFLKTD